MPLAYDDSYQAPRQTLAACPTCRTHLVCFARWVMGHGKQPGYWEQLKQPVEPVFGLPYVCDGTTHVVDRSWLDDYATTPVEVLSLIA